MVLSIEQRGTRGLQMLLYGLARDELTQHRQEIHRVPDKACTIEQRLCRSGYAHDDFILLCEPMHQDLEAG